MTFLRRFVLLFAGLAVSSATLAQGGSAFVYQGRLDRDGVAAGGAVELEFRLFAQETGGRAYFVQSAAELPKIYDQISEELANQYSIAYSSKNPMRNGAWRKINVRVTRPNVVARTRSGYFAPRDKR